jgi:hypothetical protein
MAATLCISEPSAADQTIEPKSLPDATTVLEPKAVPLDFPKIK